MVLTRSFDKPRTAYIYDYKGRRLQTFTNNEPMVMGSDGLNGDWERAYIVGDEMFWKDQTISKDRIKLNFTSATNFSLQFGGKPYDAWFEAVGEYPTLSWIPCIEYERKGRVRKSCTWRRRRRIVSTEGTIENTHAATFNKDGTQVLIGYTDFTARLWNVRTGALVKTFSGHPHFVIHVAFSSDSSRVVTGTRTTLKVWDARRGELLRTINPTASDGRIQVVQFSGDGSKVLAGFRTVAQMWSAKTGKLLWSQKVCIVKHRKASIKSMAINKDSSLVLVGCGKGEKKVKTLDGKTGNVTWTSQEFRYRPTFVDFSEDFSMMFIYTSEQTGTEAHVYTVRFNLLLRTLSMSEEAKAVSMSRDSRTIFEAVSSEDNPSGSMVKAWDMRHGTSKSMLKVIRESWFDETRQGR